MTFSWRSAAVGVHGRRDAVGGEHHDRAFGNLVGLLDEHRSGLRQRFHHVAVVHDLVPDVDGRAVLFQCTLDGFDGAVHAGAIPARFGQQHPLAGHRLGHRARGAGLIPMCGPMFTVGGMATRVLSADTGPPTRALSLELSAG